LDRAGVTDDEIPQALVAELGDLVDHLVGMPTVNSSATSDFGALAAYDSAVFSSISCGMSSCTPVNSEPSGCSAPWRAHCSAVPFSAKTGLDLVGVAARVRGRRPQ
jgi:hypothetical protein